MKNFFYILLLAGLFGVSCFAAPAEQFLSREDAAGLLVRSAGLAVDTKSPLAVLNSQGVLSSKTTQKYLTRAEAVTAICRVNKLPGKSTGALRFSDVPQHSWFFPYVNAAESQGWLSGLSGSFFFPKKIISRQEFSDILAAAGQSKTTMQAAVVEAPPSKIMKNVQPNQKSEQISLSFQNMEVAQVLQLLAKESGLNIILAENVRGRISGHFKDVLPETALVNIAQSANCNYVKDGNLYRVFKPTSAVPRSTNVREFRLSYADGEAVEKELIKMIPSLEGRIILTKENNTLLISARHPQLGLARDIIQSLDVPPLQVMVEAKIFEVSAEESSKIGSKLIGTQHNDADTTTFETFNLEPADRAIYVRSVDGDIQAYVSALESKTDFNMLSAPKVIVANKREAVLETTEEVAYQDETVSYTTSGEVISKKLIFKNVGTKLKLIPHINEKGFISIDLYPEISSAVIDADTSYPLTHMTKAHTQVVVKDGETFLIGGLLRDKKEKVVKKVPLLGDIPWLGFLFRRTEEENVKKDIMIMITPTIIDPFKAQAK